MTLLIDAVTHHVLDIRKYFRTLIIDVKHIIGNIVYTLLNI